MKLVLQPNKHWWEVPTMRFVNWIARPQSDHVMGGELSYGITLELLNEDRKQNASVFLDYHDLGRLHRALKFAAEQGMYLPTSTIQEGGPHQQQTSASQQTESPTREDYVYATVAAESNPDLDVADAPEKMTLEQVEAAINQVLAPRRRREAENTRRRKQHEQEALILRELRRRRAILRRGQQAAEEPNWPEDAE